jgi:hypothetical protein
LFSARSRIEERISEMLIKNLTKGLYFQADPGAGGGGDPGKTDKKPESFDAFIESQPDDIKTLYQTHTAGLQSALQKERDANKKAKEDAKRLSELEAKEKEREDASKSEMDKIAERATKAEAERDAAIAEREAAKKSLQAERIRNVVIANASKAGFVDPEDAYALIDLASIKIDEEDKVTGVDEAVKKLAEAKPHLLGQAKKGDGVGTPRGGQRKKEEKDNQNRVPVIRSL